jgi:hypothetical protein
MMLKANTYSSVSSSTSSSVLHSHFWQSTLPLQPQCLLILGDLIHVFLKVNFISMLKSCSIQQLPRDVEYRAGADHSVSER